MNPLFSAYTRSSRFRLELTSGQLNIILLLKRGPRIVNQANVYVGQVINKGLVEINKERELILTEAGRVTAELLALAGFVLPDWFEFRQDIVDINIEELEINQAKQ